MAQPETTRTTEADYRRLIDENQRRIYAYILTLLPSIDDAWEVFQNTCVVMTAKFSQFDPTTDFTRWACQIAHFEVCNYRRRLKRDSLLLGSDVVEMLATKQVEAVSQAEARQSALQGCLGKLRPKDRELIEARYRRGVTSRQLAADLGRPADTVYKALRRIRLALQECIERTLTREARGE